MPDNQAALTEGAMGNYQYAKDPAALEREENVLVLQILLGGRDPWLDFTRGWGDLANGQSRGPWVEWKIAELQARIESALEGFLLSCDPSAREIADETARSWGDLANGPSLTEMRARFRELWNRTLVEFITTRETTCDELE